MGPSQFRWLSDVALVAAKIMYTPFVPTDNQSNTISGFQSYAPLSFVEYPNYFGREGLGDEV